MNDLGPGQGPGDRALFPDQAQHGVPQLFCVDPVAAVQQALTGADGLGRSLGTAAVKVELGKSGPGQQPGRPAVAAAQHAAEFRRAGETAIQLAALLAGKTGVAYSPGHVFGRCRFGEALNELQALSQLRREWRRDQPYEVGRFREGRITCPQHLLPGQPDEVRRCCVDAELRVALDRKRHGVGTGRSTEPQNDVVQKPSVHVALEGDLLDPAECFSERWLTGEHPQNVPGPDFLFEDEACPAGVLGRL